VLDNPSSAKPFVAWALGLSRSGLTDLPEIGLAHEAAAAALYRLMKRAQKAGFKLSIASGYRDYERQLASLTPKYAVNDRSMLIRGYCCRSNH